MLTMRINALIVMLLTGLVAATFGFGIYLFAQLVPDMRASLGFDISYVGTLTASGQFGFLICALLAAWITPRIGGGWVIFGSGVVCAVALLLIPLTHNILLIGALLTILAGTAATVFVPMVDVISRTVAYKYRGMAMGLVSSGTSYGVFINSLLVPLYAPQGEWRMVWWIVGLITVVLAVGVMVVFSRARLFARNIDSPAQEETQVTVGKSALMQPWVLMVWAMNFLLGFSTFPFQNYLSSYLRTELNFDVAYAAQIWASIGFVGMFSGLIVGWLSDRTGLRAAMLLVYACVAGAALIFVVHPVGYWPLAAGILFAVAFYPIFGVANILQGVGGMIGNFCAGLLASFNGSFVGVYAVIGVVALLMAGVTLRLPREGQGVQSTVAVLCSDG
jgi:predicted MFS family arabinose efflux permease